MFTAKQFRAKAAESAESLKRTNDPGEIRKFQKSEQSFSALAQNEDWLADNYNKMIRPGDMPSPSEAAAGRRKHKPVAKTEEHILRCLGAAVIMRWNTLPTKLQRELFDTAGSMGQLLETVALRGQIARFLHDHSKGTPALDVSTPPLTQGEPGGS